MCFPSARAKDDAVRSLPGRRGDDDSGRDEERDYGNFQRRVQVVFGNGMQNWPIDNSFYSLQTMMEI